MSEQVEKAGEEGFEAYVYRAFVAPDERLRSVWRFFLSFIVMIFATFGAGMAASPFGRGRAFELAFRPLSLVLVVAGFCLLLKVADGVEGNPLPAMGLWFRKPWLRDAAIGMVIGFALIFVAYVVIRLTCELTANIYISARAGKLLIAELVILAAGAMLEEAMFRGYPFQRLVESFSGAARWLTRSGLRSMSADTANRSGAFVAAILWSSAFGALHLRNPQASVWSFLNTAFVGVLFCLAYLRTRSLWMPWGIHFAWNTTLGVILGLPVSGLTDFGVVVRSKAVGPVWITGGKYGIEASALGTAVIVLGIVIVLMFVKQRAAETATPLSGSPDGLLTPDGINPARIQMQ